MKTKAFIFKSGMTGVKKDSDGEYTTLNLYQVEEKKEDGKRYLGYAKRNKNTSVVDGKKKYSDVKEDENLFFMYAPVELPLVRDLFFGDIILVTYDVSDSGTFELIDVSALLYESPYRYYDFAAHSDGIKVHAALKYRESLKQQGASEGDEVKTDGDEVKADKRSANKASKSDAVITSV